MSAFEELPADMPRRDLLLVAVTGLLIGLVGLTVGLVPA